VAAVVHGPLALARLEGGVEDAPGPKRPLQAPEDARKLVPGNVEEARAGPDTVIGPCIFKVLGAEDADGDAGVLPREGGHGGGGVDGGDVVAGFLERQGVAAGAGAEV
jgi:hypothetical protein